MTTQPSTPAWRISLTEESGRIKGCKESDMTEVIWLAYTNLVKFHVMNNCTGR